MSIKYGILALLHEHQRHGYDLKVEMENLLSIKGKINAGQIYTTLDRLVRDELVSAADSDESERKYFQLEPKGQAALEKWFLTPVSYQAKDDFSFKWSCARKIKYEKEEKMLDNQKKTIMKEIMELTKLKTDLLADGEHLRYTLISGTIMHLEADLSWIRMIEVNRSPNI
ncbi:helix-turn-helix transcriptional regulator [Salicibibacter cibarius]|uniref:Helix-turn-helix transcriptional regulator n=1 Tax=Salicibibacter cibarius TaxID=2743000 RepID=A0A7T6Z152_9BACI|nr:PadR family transcriptional regulator [Salicibibacter cibarius]QQK74873.1 helix-turn-helix transcriptional regulator [Salicibibacter cibarius]